MKDIITTFVISSHMTVIQEPKKGQLTVTLPQQIARAMKWKKGTELVFNYDGEFVAIREIKSQKPIKKV